MERMHARTSKAADLQRKPDALHVSTPGDRYEREADQVADAVVRGGDHAFSITKLGADQVQRQDEGKPKTEEEKQREAALKAAEAEVKSKNPMKASKAGAGGAKAPAAKGGGKK